MSATTMATALAAAIAPTTLIDWLSTWRRWPRPRSQPEPGDKGRQEESSSDREE